jgi:hypothetical protein
MTTTITSRFAFCVVAAATLFLSAAVAAGAQSTAPSTGSKRDGSHDFDFLIGEWNVHLKNLPERLVGSTAWIEYDGTSSTHKILGSNANIEDYKVDSAKDNKHIHIQALRLYNPDSRQWAVYGLDVDKGSLSLPPTVGEFVDGHSELYDYEDWKGRWVLVRYVWSHTGENAAHFEQAFSADGGKTWEVNWISDHTRK